MHKKKLSVVAIILATITVSSIANQTPVKALTLYGNDALKLIKEAQEDKNKFIAELEKESVGENFLITKEWYYWDDDHKIKGHSQSSRDTPFSVTVKVPKKLYYDGINSKINYSLEELLSEKNDMQILENFISEVEKEADEYNIPEENKIPFLLAATVRSSDLFLGIAHTKNKTSIESFIEGEGTNINSIALLAKICKISNVDAIILQNKNNPSNIGLFISGCTLDNKQLLNALYAFNYNGNDYAMIETGFSSGGKVCVGIGGITSEKFIVRSDSHKIDKIENVDMNYLSKYFNVYMSNNTIDKDYNKPTLSFGWTQFNNKWYYSTNGIEWAKNKWELINGNWYYFLNDGTMTINTVIDGYKINSDGIWIK